MMDEKLIQSLKQDADKYRGYADKFKDKYPISWHINLSIAQGIEMAIAKIERNKS